MNDGFTFADARAIVPYLRELGISHLYSSPIFKARPGSQHGYDVVDPTVLNPQLGTEDDFRALIDELHRHDMGLVLDIVPNHMATGVDNQWWMDVLEKGPASEYARYFDIDWRTSFGKPNLENKVLLPVLGKPYGEALQNGELKLSWEGDRLWVRYFDHRFPASRDSYGLVLDSEERSTGSPADAVERINRNANAIDRVLEEQYYRLAFWRLASEELNYRRFFDIGELIGVKVEDEKVFSGTHAFINQLVSSGDVNGLRIDHIDGLLDPLTYLHRVRNLGSARSRSSRSPENGERRTENEHTYVIVEKILDAHECLPREMDADGTTGYDFLNLLNSVSVDREGVRSLEQTYREFTGIHEPFERIVYRRKKRAVARLFAGEIGRLSRRLAVISARDLVARDIPLIVLVNSLVDITASLPVYRTYIRSMDVSDRDRQYIETAVNHARTIEGDGRKESSYEFLRRLLTLSGPPDDETAKGWLRFVMQWQQLTGPAMAKGFEDTALYVFHPLLSLNEVGGDPEFHEETTGVEAFHRRNQQFLEQWPHSMNASTTHDTKRSEGARARLGVLSEIPDEWQRRLRKWSRVNESLKKEFNGAPAPDANEEILLYQALLGSWPLNSGEVADFRTRFRAYVVKAAREAKTHSSWVEPRENYEKLLIRFSDALMKTSGKNAFLDDLLDLHARISFFGAINSLAHSVLKMTSPGVPDFYQGTDLWDFSMVDPDNRRPVDYAKRAKMLRAMAGDVNLDELLASWRDGRVKLFTIHRVLAERNRSELFERGDYIPLRATGDRAENICAFARTDGKEWLITIVPRLCTRLTRPERFPLGKVWNDSRLQLPSGAPESWGNIFTGEDVRTQRSSLRLAEVFAGFPVAVLVGS